MPPVSKPKPADTTPPLPKLSLPDPKGNGRPVLYPTPTPPPEILSVEKMKSLLGWTEEGVNEKWGADFLLLDKNNKKIRCVNNVTNRPLTMSNVESLIQEILMERWRFNAEPIIIGKTGLVLNGQHTLIAGVLAEQIRTGKNQGHWEEHWTGPIVITKAVTYGVEEEDDVINTMDTCKPRSLADVIYRSPYFKDLKTEGDRRIAARSLDYAIKFLWLRTGLVKDAYAPRRTHSEALDFLARHPRLEAAVNHVMTENTNNAITRYIGLGYAAGLLYMMGVSETDGATYREHQPVSETNTNLSRWDKAEEFWTLFAHTAPDFQEVRWAIGALADPEGDGDGSLKEKWGVLIKAWRLFISGHVFKKEDPLLSLEYATDPESGIKKLVECPDLGGIDVGDPREATLTPPVAPVPVATPSAPADDGTAQLQALKAKWPEHLLIFPSKSGHMVWGGDTIPVAGFLQKEVTLHANGLNWVTFPKSAFQDVVNHLHADKRKVAEVTRGEGDLAIVTPILSEEEKRPKANISPQRKPRTVPVKPSMAAKDKAASDAKLAALEKAVAAPTTPAKKGKK